MWVLKQKKKDGGVTEQYEKREEMSDKKHWNWKKCEDESVQLVLLFFYFAFQNQKYNLVFLQNLVLFLFTKLKYICVRERHLYGCRCMALSIPLDESSVWYL